MLGAVLMALAIAIVLGRAIQGVERVPTDPPLAALLRDESAREAGVPTASVVVLAVRGERETKYVRAEVDVRVGDGAEATEAFLVHRALWGSWSVVSGPGRSGP